MMQLTDIEKAIVRKHIEYAGMKEDARRNRIAIEMQEAKHRIDTIIKNAKNTGLYAEQIALMKQESKSYKRR
jgi:hypothetical protein